MYQIKGPRLPSAGTSEIAANVARALGGVGGAPRKRTWGQDQYRVKTGEHGEISIAAGSTSAAAGHDGEADNTHDIFRTPDDALLPSNELRRTRDDGANGSGSDDDDMFGDDDAELDKIHAARAAQMQKHGGKIAEYRARGHGEVQTIVQDEFIPAVTKSKYAMCHFFHKDFELCKAMDKHLAAMAPKYLPVRIVRIDAEKTPFFVEKLKVRTLPTVVLFKDGKAVDKILGFAGCGDETDSVSTADVIKRIKMGRSGVLRSLSSLGQEREGDSEDEKEEMARRAAVRTSKFAQVADSEDDDD